MVQVLALQITEHTVQWLQVQKTLKVYLLKITMDKPI